MSIWQVVILAIVEGVSEFLPISSTGHLVLTSSLLHIQQTEFVKSFEIAIQLGAILSIVVLYRDKLLNDSEVLKRVMVAFIPTMVLGFLGYEVIKMYLLGNVGVTVGALLIGGVVMVLWDRIGNQAKKTQLKIRDLSYKKAIIVGGVQAVSMIPGVSRAMATIFGGLGVGLSREAAVEMSFLLAVPTMAAATGLDLMKTGMEFSAQEWALMGMGFCVAFGVAMVAVKWLVAYVKNHNFAAFGVYRIMVAGVFGLIFLGGS